MNNPKELQIKIELLRKEIADIKTNTGFDSASAIAKKQSEIFVLASQLSEVATRRIIYLTWVIAVLTAFLVFSVFFEFPKFAVQFNQKPYFSIQKADKSKENKPPNNKNNLTLSREVVPHTKIQK